MNNFEKCVHVQDTTKVAYWRKEDRVHIYPLADGMLASQPGQVAVWVNQDGPALDIMSEAEFSERFVTEDNLPPHMAGHLAAAPSYEEWVRSTHAAGGAHA